MYVSKPCEATNRGASNAPFYLPPAASCSFFCISNLEKKLRESILNTKIADSTIFIKYGGNLSEGSYEIV